MEHGDNYAQNLLDNMQIASGGVGVDVGGYVVDVDADVGTGGGFVGNVVGGGKYEEDHDDEDELKYIKEVQQSEKQQQLKTPDGSGFDVFSAVDAALEGFDSGIRSGFGEIVGNSNGNGNGGGHIDSHFFDNIQQEDDDFLIGRRNGAELFGNGVNIGGSEMDAGYTYGGHHALDEEDVEIIRNDGDFSTTSNTDDNTASTAEGDEPVAEVPQVEMKIEAAARQEREHQLEEIEADEEEPSSLATNTTNGTSSLSENPPQPQIQPHLVEEVEVSLLHPLESQQEQEPELEQQTVALVDSGEILSYDVDTDNKENADPLAALEGDISGRITPLSTEIGEHVVDAAASGDHQLPIDLERQHSQLNPEAKEFVPNFGPHSPTSPFADEVPSGGPFDLIQPQIHPVMQLIASEGADDVVAASPRKGRDCNMDTIILPPECEFENEAAKRPHELESEDDLNNISHLQETNIVIASQVETEKTLDLQGTTSPASSFIDHGPETSVDLDHDMEAHQAADDVEVDIIKDSAYHEHEHEQEQTATKTEPPIEELLNTVQPLPLDPDSLNESFVEEVPQLDRATFEKELLFNEEEKERVSHSPSTEELQMNLRNELHSAGKDIMQESFYLEETSAEAQEQEQNKVAPAEYTASVVSPALIDSDADYSMLRDTTNPFDNNASLSEPADSSFETFQATKQVVEEQIEALAAPTPLVAVAATHELLFEQEAEDKGAFDTTPSPQFSTEEKHLVEETKEVQRSIPDLDELEQQITDPMSAHDGNLLQVEEVAEKATAIANLENPFFSTQAAEQKLEAPVSPDLFEYEQEEQHTQSPPPQQQQQQVFNETLSEPIATEFISEPVFEPTSIPEHEHEEIPIPREAAEAEVEAEPAINAIPAAVALVPETKPEYAPELEPASLSTFIDVVHKEVVTSEPIVEALIEPAVEVEAEAEEVATLAAAAAVGAAVVGAGVVAATVAAKKSETEKKPTSASAKGRVATSATAKPKAAESTVKKTTAAVEAKKSTSTTSAAKPASSTASARLRAAPSKPAVEKKTATTTATTKSAAAPAGAPTRKPLSAATKPTTARPTSAATSATARSTTTSRTTVTARPTTAPTHSTTARKPISATTATHSTSAAPKPRPTTAPTKPTTLGLTSTAAARPKLSPRSTMTTQVRKTTGTSPGAPAKSPSKTAPATNGLATGSRTSTTTASRAATRATTTTTTTTTTTKTFTARPAPKFTQSSTTTARRVTLGATPNSKTTTSSTATNSSSALRKTASPSKPTTVGKISPTKPSTLHPKTKTPTSTKTTGVLKQKQPLKAEAPKTNGALEKLQLEPEPQPQQENEAHVSEHGEQLALQQNGHAHTNGDGEQQTASSIPTAEVALIDA